MWQFFCGNLQLIKLLEYFQRRYYIGHNNLIYDKFKVKLDIVIYCTLRILTILYSAGWMSQSEPSFSIMTFLFLPFSFDIFTTIA